MLGRDPGAFTLVHGSILFSPSPSLNEAFDSSRTQRKATRALYLVEVNRQQQCTPFGRCGLQHPVIKSHLPSFRSLLSRFRLEFAPPICYPNIVLDKQPSDWTCFIDVGNHPPAFNPLPQRPLSAWHPALLKSFDVRTNMNTEYNLEIGILLGVGQDSSGLQNSSSEAPSIRNAKLTEHRASTVYSSIGPMSRWRPSPSN
ncbi:hypothetical protein OG21DRAFT_1504473 [Imleria badia]|nr:hypothetical protein OG21DRAFT_1504473 [Imleria badia]